MQKFYLHDAATTNTGTLPSGGSSSSSAVTVTGSGTNRLTNGTPGTLQIAVSFTTLALSGNQGSWVRRFLSPALAPVTFTSSDQFTLHNAMLQSSTNSGLQANLAIGVWRPSTGTQIGTWMAAFTNVPGLWGPPAGTAETAGSGSRGGLNTVTLQDGDFLIFDLWTVNNQSAAMGYTNTLYYDGTTDDSATSNAAYILAPFDLLLSGQTVTPRPQQRSVQQAVQRAGMRCWGRLRSGIIVPKLWTPEGAQI